MVVLNFGEEDIAKKENECLWVDSNVWTEGRFTVLIIALSRPKQIKNKIVCIYGLIIVLIIIVWFNKLLG